MHNYPKDLPCTIDLGMFSQDTAKMDNIDTIDRKILNALQRDAGQSLETLGADVGLSRNACWRRIRALEEAGVITGRIATLDARKLGLGLTVFMQISFISG